MLLTLAWRLSNNVNPCCQQITWISQLQGGFPTSKEFLKDFLELLVDLMEGLAESLDYFRIHLIHGFL